MEHFIERNKIQHEKRVRLLHENLTIINRDRDNDIRTKSQLVCTELKLLFVRIESAIKKHTFDFQAATPSTLNNSVYKSLHRKVSKRCAISKLMIRTLIEQLRAIEGHRMRQFREQLIIANTDLNSIAFQFPFDIGVCIEQHATFMNQMAFANYHNYSDLMADLMGIVATRELAWLDKISALNEVFEVERGKQIAIMCNPESLINLDTFDENLECIRSAQDVQNLANSIAQRLMQTTATIQSLINVLIMYLNKLLKQDYKKLHTLESRISRTPSTQSINHTDIVHAIYSTLSNDEENPKSVISQWHQWTKEYTSEVDNCQKTVIDGLYLWDDHFKRMAQIDAVCSKELYRVANQMRDVDHISDLNHHIDVLRTSPDIETLKTTLAKCVTIIDQIRESVDSIREESLRVIDECRKLEREDAKLHQLELMHFVEQEHLGEWIDPTEFHTQVQVQCAFETMPIVITFNGLLKNLHNWLFGRNRYLMTIANSCSDNIRLQTELILIEKQYDMQTNAIDDVWRRIFQRVYRVRFAEILQHQMQINAHIAAVSNAILSDGMLTLAKEKFAKKVKEIQGEMSANMDKLSMLQLKRQARRLLDELHKDEVAGLQKQCKELSSSTAAYLNHLRLFVDGGNYAAEEVNRIQIGLEPLLVAIKEYKSNQTEALDALCNMTIPDVNTMIQSSIDKIDETTNSLEFDKNIRACMLQAGNDLRDATQSLLRCNGNLNASIRRLHELANLPNCPDNFITECNRLRIIFEELLSLLVGEGDNAAKLFADAVRKFLKVSQNTNEEKNEIDDDGMFMADVWRILSKTLHRIGEFVEAHYNDVKDDCMTTNIAKLMFYQLQCDEIQLQVMINYFLQLDKVITCIAHFYRCYVIQYVGGESKQIISICKSFRSKVKEDRCILEEEYERLHKKLMPLYGHPKNSELLDDLRRQFTDVQNKAISRQVHVTELYNQCEQNVNVCVDHLEQVLTTCTNRIITHHRNFQAIFRDESHAKLHQQLCTKIEHFEQMRGKHWRTSAKEQYDNKLIAKLEAIHQRKRGLKVYSKELAKGLKVKWEEASTVYTKHAKRATICDLANVFDSSTPFRNVRSIWMAKMTKFKNDYGALEIACKEWMNIWNNDIGEINSLYALNK